MHRAASVGPGYFSPPTARPTGPGRGPRPVPDKDAVCGPLRDARVHRPDPHGGEMEGRGGGGDSLVTLFQPFKGGDIPRLVLSPDSSVNKSKEKTDRRGVLSSNMDKAPHLFAVSVVVL